MQNTQGHIFQFFDNKVTNLIFFSKIESKFRNQTVNRLCDEKYTRIMVEHPK